MEDLVVKRFRQRFAFIKQNPRRRTGARVQQVRHHTGIILVPFVKDLALLRRPERMPFLPCRGPARTSDFIGIAIVPVCMT